MSKCSRCRRQLLDNYSYKTCINCREYRKQYYYTHREQELIYSRQYYSRHREEILKRKEQKIGTIDERDLYIIEINGQKRIKGRIELNTKEA